MPFGAVEHAKPAAPSTNSDLQNVTSSGGATANFACPTVSPAGLRACAERYASGIVRVLAGLGLPPELTAPWRSERDLVALHIRPEQVFVQTPGPHAGSPLGGRDG